MRIVVVGTFWSHGMGYTENCLPRALADLGHEVHCVTSNLNWYGNNPQYKEIYEKFNGPAEQPVGEQKVHNFTLHLLPHKTVGHYIITIGLVEKILSLNPDIIQSTDHITPNAILMARGVRNSKAKVFTELHQHMSVVHEYMRDPNGSKLKRAVFHMTRRVPGRVVSQVSRRCYAIAPDCMEVGERIYGIPREKLKLLPLGTDTSTFHPVTSDADMSKRSELRKGFGFGEHEVVCIYTGRFTEAKNPLVLAKAIEDLRGKGLPFRGLFVGDGPQLESILACEGCAHNDFVRHDQLAELYRLADLAVWPREESMSMLDAAASGLPLVVSNKMGSPDRIDGNGAVYSEPDPASLAATLQELQDPGRRAKMSAIGRDKMVDRFSWARNAKLRLEDYNTL